MDNLVAARLQMAVSLGFHMIFAAIGIGLPLLMVLVERRWISTGQPHYKALAKTWAKATGILFAVGAVSGTALSFELGLLWPKYMELTGAVVGHIFGLEGYAFFIEAIFIALYLYGWDRLSQRAHWWCGVVVAISGMISGIFILGVNAWMQLPVGFTMEGGKVAVSDPIAIFKRPGWFYMALHSTLSCYIAVSFAVAGVYAAAWIRGRRDAATRSAIRLSLAVGAIVAVMQPLSGDFLAKFVFETQKPKFAAMEGQFRTQKHAPLRIGGWPDVEAGETKYAIEIPGGLSFLATHDFNAEVPGLDQVPKADWPAVEVVHMAFQAMVGFGMALIGLSAWFWLATWRKGEGALDGYWLPRAILVCGSFGFLALETGWIVTEVGRQPWIINGVMRTSESVTPASGVSLMFFSFSLLYLILGVTVVMLLRGLRAGERVIAPQEDPIPTNTPGA
ncbi:cytochrome ubiquinol oxidase subunit I [Tundrisphaera sp. TA3]|uniref:cytochrome ubiquinol oxidase subunit I n=1 Tax=Tundrisphaera sp. TA3 TaxID=3435775 RepID=UPI003EB9F9DF